MAKTKVYAPEGHHFMVNKEGGFYLMKNPASGYKAHTVGGEKSSLYILLEVRDYHQATPVSSTTSSRGTYNNTTTRRARRTTTTARRSTSSGGGRSGGSSGGGY